MRPAHYGATYDDWFTGGWDEVFPNDYPVTVAGERYPDHGEIWSLPARWRLLESTDDTVSIELEHRGIAFDTRFSKTLMLGSEDGALRIRYEVTNTGRVPLQGHWKMHPALPLRPGARLHLPARRVEVDPDFSAGFAVDAWAWLEAPLAGGSTRDLRALPDPDSGDVWFFYATELTAGSCGVSYPHEDVGFGLTFDPALLSSVWVFSSFGGWRGLSTIIIEPCTGHRARLDDAIAHGSVMTLQAGECRSTDVVMTVLNGEGSVTSGAADPRDP